MSYLLFVIACVCYCKSQVILFKDDYDGKGKYQQPARPAPDTWYYRFFKIKYKERFPGSGSFLVSLTDSYHRWQLFFHLSIVGSIILYRPWLGGYDGLLYFALWGVAFSLTYRLIRNDI